MGLHQIFTRRGILLYSIVVASHIECRGLNHRHVSILKWTDMLLSVVLLLLSSHIIAQRHAPISHLSVSLLIKLSLKQLSFLLLGFLHLVSVTLNQASTELHDTGFEITLYFLERDSRTEWVRFVTSIFEIIFTKVRYCVLRGIVYIAGLIDCDSIALSLLILPLLGTLVSARFECLVHSIVGHVGLLLITMTDFVRGSSLECLDSYLVC